MPTKIEWAQETWNPVTGCSKISPGCANCYAERMAKRLAGRCGYPKGDPFRVTFHADRLEKPREWRKPRMIFVVSMGDLFHDGVDSGWQYKIVKTAYDLRYRHTFLFLTKRPENMLRFFTDKNIAGYCSGKPFIENGRLPSSFWFGVTAESQEQADRRIPILLQIPAAVRFVSIEPMLGPVVMRRKAVDDREMMQAALMGRLDDYSRPVERGIDWVIVGGETGPRARPMQTDWARSLRDQCQAAGVPFFFKKHGDRWCKEFCVNPKYRENRELDGVEHNAFPEVKR